MILPSEISVGVYLQLLELGRDRKSCKRLLFLHMESWAPKMKSHKSTLGPCSAISPCHFNHLLTVWLVGFWNKFFENILYRLSTNHTFGGALNHTMKEKSDKGTERCFKFSLPSKLVLRVSSVFLCMWNKTIDVLPWQDSRVVRTLDPCLKDPGFETSFRPVTKCEGKIYQLSVIPG